jgi:hypothetical protein
MRREKHSTFNIEHSTPNVLVVSNCQPLNVGRWMLNVECFLLIHPFRVSGAFRDSSTQSFL